MVPEISHNKGRFTKLSNILLKQSAIMNNIVLPPDQIIGLFIYHTPECYIKEYFRINSRVKYQLSDESNYFRDSHNSSLKISITLKPCQNVEQIYAARIS